VCVHDTNDRKLITFQITGIEDDIGPYENRTHATWMKAKFPTIRRTGHSFHVLQSKPPVGIEPTLYRFTKPVQSHSAQRGIVSLA
jgi:hypothetical protein